MAKSKNANKDKKLRIILVQNLLFQIFAGSKYSHNNIPLNLLRPFMNVMMLLFQRRLVISTVQWVPKENEYQIVTCSVVDHTLHYAYKIKDQMDFISPDNEADYLIPIKHVDDDERDIKRKYFFMLHELPKKFYGEPIILTAKLPDFILFQDFLASFSQQNKSGYNVIKWMNCALDSWRSSDGGEFKARSCGQLITKNENIEIDQKIIAQLIGHVSEVLDDLYKGARDLSFLNQDAESPRPNIFFALKTAGREEPRFNMETEHVLYRKRGYSYDLRIIIPATQKTDWLSFEGGVNEKGQTKGLVNNNDLELISRKFVNERSTLDEPLSSGILTLPQIGIESSKFQAPDPEMSKNEKKQKEERHKITTKIFKHIIGIDADDTKTELRLNAYPIHFFGSPYLIVGTFTTVDLTEKSFDVEAWTHNFHYYSEYIRVAFSRKFRGRLRRKLLDVIYGQTKSIFDVFDVEDETEAALLKIIEINKFFFHMALVFPIPQFIILPVIPIRIRHFERQWGDGRLGTYRGVGLYLTAEQNKYFVKNMKRPQKSFFYRVLDQIKRGVQDRRQECVDAYTYSDASIYRTPFFKKVSEIIVKFKGRRLIIFDTENEKGEPDNRLLPFLETYIQAIHTGFYDGNYPLNSLYFSEDIKDNYRNLYTLSSNLRYTDDKVVGIFSHQEVKKSTKNSDKKGAYVISLEDKLPDEIYGKITDIIVRKQEHNYILYGPNCSKNIKLGIKGIQLSSHIGRILGDDRK